MTCKFKCGLCKSYEQYVGTRLGLRKHLRDEHRILTSIANTTDAKGGLKKQRWWKVEEWK